MTYRVTFWKPKTKQNLWLPVGSPLGEEILKTVRCGQVCEHLIEFPTDRFFRRLKDEFSGIKDRDDGSLYWTDESSNGFIASRGRQYVDVCCFDLEEDDLDRLFEIANSFACEHFD